MRIHQKSPEVYLIIVIFFFSIFNDIIRIPNTTLSAYRLLITLSFVIIFLHLHEFRKMICLMCFGIILFLLQNTLVWNILKIEVNWDYKRGITYLIHYTGIIIIFMLMRILRKKDEKTFKTIFDKGMISIGILCMVCYMLTIMKCLDELNFDNINNYGCYLAVVFPFYLLKGLYERKKYFLLCILIFIELWIGDSKAALLGIVIQTGILGAIMLSKKIKQGSKLIYFSIPIVIIAIILLCISPLRINGYSIKELTLGMVTHIVRGEAYSNNLTSLTFRTNAIVYMLQAIRDSFFIGIGPGNSGKLLAYNMSDLASLNRAETLSPHNALLEFWTDCGIWAIAISVYIICIAVKKLYKAKTLDRNDIYFVAFALSFPMWVISASGIYTTYLIFIVIAWMYENYQLKRSRVS